jgi:hypothetical protein
MGMVNSNNQQICRCRCDAPVPAELKPVGFCVSHFTLSVERTCDEMHRQIALRQANAARRAEVATYMGECALLLARVASNLCLSDDLRRRMLSTFLSLMNLRENLERAASCVPELQPSEGAETQLPLMIAKHDHPYEGYH